MSDISPLILFTMMARACAQRGLDVGLKLGLRLTLRLRLWLGIDLGLITKSPKKKQPLKRVHTALKVSSYSCRSVLTVSTQLSVHFEHKYFFL